MKQFQYLLFICQVLLFLLPLTGTAQVSEEGAVKKTIELFFEGFHQKDPQILTQTTDSLFTLNSVTPNIGGIGSVSYSLDGILNSNESPGIFDFINSSNKSFFSKKQCFQKNFFNIII